MKRADRPRNKAADAATLAFFEEALEMCHGNIQELARRMSRASKQDYAATTLYGWRARGRVPRMHMPPLQKVLRAPRQRHRGRSLARAA